MPTSRSGTGRSLQDARGGSEASGGEITWRNGDPYRQLWLVAAIQVLAMSVWFATAAVVPSHQRPVPLHAAYLAAVRATVAVLVRSDVDDMSLMEAWLQPFVVLCEPAGDAPAAARASMRQRAYVRCG